MIKTVPNNDAIAAVADLIKEGRNVVLPVKGNSMLPFIIGGRESVELVKPETVAVGDVVLAWINGNRFVIHRIIRIEGNQVQLMGDGNLTAEEYCQISDVKARAEYVITPHGKRRYLYTPQRIRLSLLWKKLLLVRRWILAVYRRTLLKLSIHL